jgi:hypothetical protein
MVMLPSATTAIAAIALIATIALVAPFSLQPAASQPGATSVTKIISRHQTIIGDFFFRSCVTGNDPHINPQKPWVDVTLSRSSGEKVTIPFCIAANRDTAKVFDLHFNPRPNDMINETKLPDGSLQGTMANGIVASLDMGKLNLPAKNNGTISNSQQKNVDDNKFNLHLTAGPNTTLGEHLMGIWVMELDKTGQTGQTIIQWVHIHIVK